MSTIRLYYGRDSGEMIRKIEEALVDDKKPVVSAIEVRETVLEDDVIEAIVKLISSGSVESIQLDDCGAYLNKSAVQMARALGACKHVRLSEPTFLTNFFLECFLVSATKLRSLRIQDRLLVEQVEALSNGLRSNNTLHTLDLSRSRIDDFSILAEGLRGSCVKSIKLRSIGLRDTHVTTMMACLESSSVLESLDLSFNHIRNLTALGKFLRCADCNLRELSIGYQNIWQSPNIDIGELAEALKVNKTLTTLKLTRNKLIDSDAIIISMALMHSTLENLDVRENNFSDIGIIHLAKTARDNSKGLRRIYTSNNPFGRSGSLALLEAAATNYNLVHIDTNCKDDDRINKQIRYHIVLNRGGRKLLLENPPLALWPLAMERSQTHLEEYYASNNNNNNVIIDDDDDDMDFEANSCDINMRSDVLYYLLKENPSTFFF